MIPRPTWLWFFADLARLYGMAVLLVSFLAAIAFVAFMFGWMLWMKMTGRA